MVSYPASVDPVQLRKTLAQFATGVAIVTCFSEQQPLGLTINSVSSLSMTPPLLAWSLHQSSLSLTSFLEAEYFLIHILDSSQISMAEQFYQRKSNERFVGVHYQSHPQYHAPMLPDCLAWIACKHSSAISTGDHQLIIGEVKDFMINRQTEPLVFFRSQFYTKLTTLEN